MSNARDDFRRLQRAQAYDGGGHAGCYGCSCCRKIAHLGKFKKWSRKHARRRLHQADDKNFGLITSLAG